MSPSYFFYELTLEEAEAWLRGHDEAQRSSWVQTRMLAYIIAQVNSRRRLKPEDIMKFPWETKTGGGTAPTEDELEDLRRTAEEMEKILIEDGKRKQ